MHQAHIHFTGMVQGVGFRFTTQSFARKFNLGGWVKNLPDGSLEIVAQGEKNDVDELCEALKGHFGSYIRAMDLAWEETSETFQGFHVRY